MPNLYSTGLTDTQETYSDGALRNLYLKLLNLESPEQVHGELEVKPGVGIPIQSGATPRRNSMFRIGELELYAFDADVAVEDFTWVQLPTSGYAWLPTTPGTSGTMLVSSEGYCAPTQKKLNVVQLRHDSDEFIDGFSAGFVDRASELEQAGMPDSALDLIYDSVDELLLRARYPVCTALFSRLPIDSYSVDILLALLTTTLPAKSQIPSRGRFLKQVEDSLRRRGEDVDALLMGLA